MVPYTNQIDRRLVDMNTYETYILLPGNQIQITACIVNYQSHDNCINILHSVEIFKGPNFTRAIQVCVAAFGSEKRILALLFSLKEKGRWP